MTNLKFETSPFDSLSSAYDTWFEDEGKAIFTIEVQAFQKVLPFLPKPWLEMGVGSGRFAQALGIENGLDPSIKLLDMAKNRGTNVFLGKGESCPFKEATFGAVFLIITLCFVDSPLTTLRQTNRILRNNGKIVLGLILLESPWGQFYQSKKERGHRFYKHANFYNYDEVVRLLEGADFKVEKVLSTLYQLPEKVKHIESPQQGSSRSAGFTVIVAGKSSALSLSNLNYTN